LRKKYDAIVLAVGATQWRDLPIKGREYKGIYQAMEFLPWGNKQALGEVENPDINVAGKHVVILGGGDTGADCLGTSIRQGAASITQLEIMPRPTEERPEGQPWPTYPMIYRVSSAHEEKDNRVFAVSTEEFLGDENGNLRAIKIVETEFKDGKFIPVVGSEKEIKCDFVFMAMGFTGPEKSPLLTQLEVQLDDRGNIKRDKDFQSTEEGVFVAGDAGRGQSLIVWAIAEGRSTAAAVDRYLTGRTQLPVPIAPTDRPLMV
jgi:glutamate synthase (NADPH/NADH) small chain